MALEALIAEAKSRGLRLSLEGEEVVIEAPRKPDRETQALIDRLREHREEVRKLLVHAVNDGPLQTSAKACWNCGASMTEAKDISGRAVWACWACAKSA